MWSAAVRASSDGGGSGTMGAVGLWASLKTSGVCTEAVSDPDEEETSGEWVSLKVEDDLGGW